MVAIKRPSLADYYDSKARLAQDRQIDAAYTDAVIGLIAAKLPCFVDGAAQARFPKEIRDWARGYIGWKSYLGRTRASANRRTVLQGIADAANDLIDACAQVDEFAWVSLVRHLRAVIAPRDHPEPPFPLLDPKFVPLLFRAEEKLTEAMNGVLLLAGAARQAIVETGPPKRGPKTRSPARRIAIATLALIYRESTGKKPTRSYDPYKRRFYGPFRDFCIAATAPIDGDKAATGIDRIIAHTLGLNDKRNV